jgi:hypothetical protein
MVRLLEAGWQGMQRAQENAARHAERIASFGTDANSNDLVTPMAGMQTAKAQMQASAAVTRTSNAMHRSLLDVLA